MEIKKTITTIFMVPTLNIPKGALKENGFINGFIKDDKQDVEYKDAVYLLFKPADLYKFRNFLDNEYERTKNVIEDYDYQDGYVVIVYKLDNKFNDDFRLIRRGKYSRTSKEFQDSFKKVVKIIIDGKHRDELSLQVRIFKKTQDLIDFWEENLSVKFSDEQECWEGFDYERETLNIDNIKEHVQ
tara:strand:+ start:36168 stop:36722 length:555 start_codon:yes stop_codon:yes gene_type:complete